MYEEDEEEDVVEYAGGDLEEYAGTAAAYPAVSCGGGSAGGDNE
jgi:hypothetical protein